MELNLNLKINEGSFSYSTSDPDDCKALFEVLQCLIALDSDDIEKVPVKDLGTQKVSKKLPASQLYDSGVKKKVNKQVIEYLRNNCLTKDNEMLVAGVKDRFKFNTTIHTIKWWMSQNGISRRRMKKEAEDHGIKFDDEKELPKLPPEDNF